MRRANEGNAAAAERGETVVVCEDDPEIRGLLSAFLSGAGFRVLTAADGVALDVLLADAPADLLVLDWMLPGEDGLSICRRLREAGGPPILMLTARGEDADRVAGLETGADAYLAKPFNTEVLLAQVRALLRRRGAAAGRARYQVADLLLDAGARRAFVGEAEVELTGGEIDLLLCLAAQPQRVLSRDELMAKTRGRAPGLFDRTIDVQVSRLRHKLEAAGSPVGGLIRAVRNAGYILAAPVGPG